MFRFLCVPVLLLLSCGLMAAADDTLPLALWSFGDGTIDGRKAQPGETILAGQELAATNDRPLRVTLADAPGSTVIISAGSTIRFLVVAAAESKADLVVEVSSGAIQIDLGNKYPWRELRVHGGALEVHVVGTLFMFERVRRDQDYIAMVHGKVRVNLIASLANALGQTQSIDLDGRRGLGGGPAGFGSIDTLSSRPQLSSAASERVGIREQGLSSGGADWTDDHALAMMAGLADVGTGPLLVTPAIDPIVTALTNDLDQTVVQSITQEAVQQVIQTVTDTNNSGPGPLPLPPLPPH